MCVVVIGVGKWGENHVRTLLELGQEVVACDTSESRIYELIGLLGQGSQLKWTTSLDDVLSRRDIKAAIVATDTSSHLDVAARFMEREILTLVEKPVAPSLREFETFLDEYPQSHKLLMAGHTAVYGEAFRALSYGLGKKRAEIVQIDSVRSQFGQYRKEGVVCSLGIHDLAMCRVLLRDEFDRIRWTSSSPPHWGDGKLGEHTVMARGTLARRGSKVLLSLTWSYSRPFRERWIMVKTAGKMPSGGALYAINEVPGRECLRSCDGGQLANFKDVKEFQWEDAWFDKRTPALKSELESFLDGRGLKTTGVGHTLSVVRAVDRIRRFG